MADFPEALAHGALEEAFPDVWTLRGLIVMGGGAIRASRNMTVVREAGALTLINTVRLDEGGLIALDALGEVHNVVKLGSYHGRDDAFYLHRYPRATLWAPPGMAHERDLVTGEELTESRSPISDAETFAFETAENVEGVLRLRREGGVLIPCDSLQNWEEPDEYFDDASKKALSKFFGRARIGHGWLTYAKPTASDFRRLAALEFSHLLPAHGTPLLHVAGEALRATFDETFG